MIKLIEVNRELKKIINYLEENKHIWYDIRNLKLYQARTYDYMHDFPLCFKSDNNKIYDNFYYFCEDSYIYFKEWLKEENIDINILNYIGSTSSFRLTNFYHQKMQFVLYEILENEKFESLNINEKCEFILHQNHQEKDIEVQDDFKYLLENLLKNVKYLFSDAIKVANYIDSFKKSQVVNFKYYLKFIEEQLQKKQKEQEEIIKKNNDRIDLIIEKTKNILNNKETEILKKLYLKKEV